MIFQVVAGEGYDDLQYDFREPVKQRQGEGDRKGSWMVDGRDRVHCAEDWGARGKRLWCVGG